MPLFWKIDRKMRQYKPFSLESLMKNYDNVNISCCFDDMTYYDFDLLMIIPSSLSSSNLSSSQARSKYSAVKGWRK